MVIIEILQKEGKISRIKETELDRYIEFFTESYQDNLKHSESNLETYPRWSIISGYYSMHDMLKNAMEFLAHQNSLCEFLVFPSY